MAGAVCLGSAVVLVEVVEVEVTVWEDLVEDELRVLEETDVLDEERALEELEIKLETLVEETCELVLRTRTELTNEELDELVADKLDTDPLVPFRI